ncbi:LCP family protein [Pseudalkalibacillus salsuginis]|uniref:LCP family glycopolymer transferase n=1 Tax=Pseudalkalibacillus salsuginis TaxID=2910972 RepID=UPI001F459201|nr:LCP family protein [Pseudalkalibacillus salsuginis]MCF6411743.1 LCP family protein [Pseudalkalibacillus salsuginis]
MFKKFVLFIATFITVLILGAGSFTWQFVTSTSSSIHEEIDIERKPEFEEHHDQINLKKSDPISILLMGIDKSAGEERGRSDTLILMTINPHTKSTHMVSIPRDTYTRIKGAEDKINSAYHVGGTAMTISSVENLLDVPVDYYVKVNMKSFVQIVDAVGGIEVNNDLDFNTYKATFTDKKMRFPKGRLNLKGEEALIFARMRKQDPRGDFGRQIRQRQVIEAVIEKGANISSVTKFGEIVKVVEHNVKTNLTFNDMWKVQSNYKAARENIQQHKIEGSDKKIKGTYYYVPDKKKLHTISNELKKHLGLDR